MLLGLNDIERFLKVDLTPGGLVALFLGILTSMFTALVGSRALLQVIYGRRRRIERLAI